jgi:hypothetical protein
VFIWRHMISTSAWSAFIAENEDFHEPAMPEGFPLKILAYGYFKRNGDWHPRQVDELTLEELEWLPVYEDAVTEAAEFIQRQEKFRSQ